MRLFIKILSLFLLLLLITAEDCSNSSPEMTRYKIQREQYQNIEEGFVSNEITQTALNAYELRAIQKIRDLSDYLSIYLDNNLEKEFREQSKVMICKTFYSNENCREFLNNLGLMEDTARVLLYRPRIMENMTFRADSIKITEGLEKSGEFEYSGKVSFDAELFIIIGNDSTLIDRKKLTIPIFVTKREKDFGDNSEKVWETLLGDSGKLYQ